MRKIAALLGIIGMSCSQGAEEQNTLNTEDSNAAYPTNIIKTAVITLQTFEQLPMEMKGCNALFVSDTSHFLPQYVFASNQKDMAFIRLNNKLTELKLVRRTTIDKNTINELYAADDVEVDLKITRDTKGKNEWNYSGVLVIRKEGTQEATEITGKLGC